jgi:NhaA family Na+:H+ antiporter
VTVGSFVGLALGKPLGVFGATWLALRLGLAPRPTGASLLQIAGVAALAGIGFTMSLFIGGLAFADHPTLVDNAKIGVLAASFVSATVGLLILRSATPPSERASTEDEDHRVLVDDDEHAVDAR